MTGIAATTAEYMRLMQSAPPLKASSLDAPYKQLLDFNGYVFGGMESKYGVQFTTWQWSYDRNGLDYGHYCGNDYASAKKDFALRAGLVPEEKRFTRAERDHRGLRGQRRRALDHSRRPSMSTPASRMCSPFTSGSRNNLLPSHRPTVLGTAG